MIYNYGLYWLTGWINGKFLFFFFFLDEAQAVGRSGSRWIGVVSAEDESSESRFFFYLRYSLRRIVQDCFAD